MKQFVNIANKYAVRKEVSDVNKLYFRNKCLKSLQKGKARSLGFFEILSMKFAGWSDGRQGLLRTTEDGNWQSSKLKEEVDSYEEFCSDLYGHLKVEEEDEFKKLCILLESVTSINKSLSEAKKRLRVALDKEIVLNERKVGEEELNEAQVIARRNREHDKLLQPFYSDVEENERALFKTVDEIFKHLSQVRESFDSTCKIASRLQQRIQRRIDVYWRSAMRQNKELPPVPTIKFTDCCEQDYRRHYEELASRAELLRNDFISEV